MSKFIEPGDVGCTYVYPSSARAGRHAARQWFQDEIALPAAEFRNRVFLANWRHGFLHRESFDQGFLEEVGRIVVEEGRFYAAAA